MKQTYLIIISFLFITITHSQQNPWYQGEYFVSGDSCSFNDTCGFVQIPQGSQWEIGTTNKPFFSNNFTSSALMTDTTDSYTDSTLSYFDLDLTGLDSYFDDFHGQTFLVEFKHKMQSDSLKDGGFITVSLDSGDTWQNLGDMDQWGGMYADLVKYNMYSTDDTLFNGDSGFSGEFDWMTSGFEFLFYYPIKFNHVNPIVRFNFISDTTTENQEGWIIDSLVIAEHYLGGSVDDHTQNIQFDVYPNPAKDHVEIRILNQNGSLNGEFSLLDLSGRKVKSKQSKATSTTVIDVSDCKPGMYIVRWIGNDGRINDKKVIVE